MCGGAVGERPARPVRSPGVSPRNEFDIESDDESDELDDLDREADELEYADGEELDEDDAEA